MSPSETEQNPPQSQKQQVMHMNPRIEKDRQLILDAQKKGRGAVFKAYVKLSGPGWLQSGITLGGGSLSSYRRACIWVCWLALALCGFNRWR